MRVLPGIISASAACLVQAAGPTAPVYTFDATPHPEQDSPLISPQEASLIFAYRLGLSQYHNVQYADESGLRHLNTFGGSQQKLFSTEEQDWSAGAGKILVVVEGVEHPEHLFDPKTTRPAFTIQNPPSSQDTLQLTLDLLAQDKHRREKDNDCVFEIPAGTDLRGGLNGKSDRRGECHLRAGTFADPGKKDDEFQAFEYLVRTANHGFGSDDHTVIVHLSTLSKIAQNSGTPAREPYKKAIQSLTSAFQYLQSHATSREATIVLMPPSASAAKRKPSPYGSYTNPKKSHQARQVQPEEPLSMASTPSTYSSNPSTPQIFPASALPRGILPVCHSTLESCIIATNNCTGHGTAARKFTSNKGSEDKNVDCYACECGNTTRVNEDGTIKTTQWGGPACQKKDISAAFWLLAGFSIVMMATVSWGVGLLFSIGQEDLPSVIGAGVAGPRAQR